MKKVLCFLGSAIYGAGVSWLLWLGLLKLNDWTMTFNWGGVIAMIIFSTPAIIWIASVLEVLLCIPMSMMLKIVKAGKWLPLAFAVFNGFSSLRLPWLYYEHYTANHIVMAIEMDILTLILFVQLFAIIWSANKKDNSAQN